MPVTTIKRCQHDPDWWYTIEDCYVEGDGEPGSGLTIKYYDLDNSKGKQQLCVLREDALLIRDAINQLYPPSNG